MNKEPKPEPKPEPFLIYELLLDEDLWDQAIEDAEKEYGRKLTGHERAKISLQEAMRIREASKNMKL